MRSPHEFCGNLVSLYIRMYCTCTYKEPPSTSLLVQTPLAYGEIISDASSKSRKEFSGWLFMLHFSPSGCFSHLSGRVIASV